MKREERMDIIKGIAIVLMVVGHSGFPYKSFIYLFHMAVFFMVSGYLFAYHKITTMEGAVKYVYRKVKGIWWPYFLWNAVYTVLNNLFIHVGIYSKEAFAIGDVYISGHSVMSIKDVMVNIFKGIFMIGRTEMGGAFWFFRTLFALAILFGIIDYVLNKIIHKDKYADVVHLIISVLFLGGGYVAQLLHIKSLVVPTILSVYILYFFGYAINKYELMKYVKEWISIPIGFIILLICNERVSISLGDNSYGNPLYLVVCSLAGWVLIYGLADILSRYRCKKIWTILGMNSMVIVIHHFWSLKLIHLIQIAIYDYPRKYLAAFPYLDTTGLWWIAYTFVGVAVPVTISILYKKGKEKVKSYA